MDNLAYGECSKPKKSKSCQEAPEYRADWAHLPALVLHKVFDLLGASDRRSTASVCRYWRQNSFHPKWWPVRRFMIEERDMDKARFQTSTFGPIVSEATVVLNSLAPACVDEFIILLRLLNENNHLRSLMLEPTHCQLELQLKIGGKRDGLAEVVGLLAPLLPRLERFSVGCIEDLCGDVEGLLARLDPSKVKLLGLATVKEDPIQYVARRFEPELISKFVNLEVLSVDYEQLSDAFLGELQGAAKLRRLVVHMHALPSDHPGTTEKAWREFRVNHPECELRLTLIHAFDGIAELHESVLQSNMPLTHLKVFFCENVNTEALHALSTFYPETFRSLMWVDAVGGGEPSWALARAQADAGAGGRLSPDPLVLLAWLCRRLDEVVLLGYKYPEENLVALGRLRGPALRRLDIAEEDVLFVGGDGCFEGGDALADVPKSLQKAWAPLKSWQLHPVVRDPDAGDSDEFILPLVLADLH